MWLFINMILSGITLGIGFGGGLLLIVIPMIFFLFCTLSGRYLKVNWLRVPFLSVLPSLLSFLIVGIIVLIEGDLKGLLNWIIIAILTFFVFSFGFKVTGNLKH